ncbi:hypothetical protein Alches_12550 [Alicyclobacillus hesperidum subsp. aegles]|uniref:hypothetical protein n=1 Tax=Alicyclobacillus hesperidum TaxID=89784 RepID=UPI00222D02B0|nr:hypothetical protein [Alicyclobacillus hesperidum]GLG01216.1 hypothetical protein Alches_12550 [Alicyclobacillus hesperidum subsp. aegles]
MDDDMTNPHESLLPAHPAEYDRFARELEERLYDGCSVTFTVPYQISATLARDVLKRLEARGCYTAKIDLSNVSTIEELAFRLLTGILQLRISIISLLNSSFSDLIESLSRPDIRANIQDVVDVPYLRSVKESPLELLDEAVSLLQRIPEQSDRRLVVWFHEFQMIEKIDDLLLKRLRAHFQHQTHVSYAFVGSDPDVMRMLFADQSQAFYRFAVMLQYAG